jgi:hypothetical protein
VLLLFRPHSLHDCATSCVRGGQSLEVAAEMVGDLTLGFLDESERPAVSEDAAGSTYRESARIPQRLQAARDGAEFRQTLLAPAQMVEFLERRRPHVFGDRIAAGDRSMALIQTLCCYLARVIDPHQPCGMSALGSGQWSVRNAIGGIRPCRAPVGARNAAQECVNAINQAVDTGEMAFLHPAIIAAIGGTAPLSLFCGAP